MIKALTSFAKSYRPKQGHQKQGHQNQGRGRGRGTTPVLMPLTDRCARCVATYIKKNPGTQVDQARVNNKGNECRRPADEHADNTHANMAVVANSLPEGITAFMAGTTGLCSTYHKFYIDSGVKAVNVNRYYRYLMKPILASSSSVRFSSLK
jgi:hypothetical protein